MAYSLGTCKHNNLTGHCPSCLREKNMRKSHKLSGFGMGRLGMAGGQMGLTCAAGMYPDPILGAVCVPSSGTLLNQVEGAFATGVATTSTVQAAAANAATQSTATALVNYVKAHPFIVGGAVLAVAALAFAGLRK